MTTGGLGNELRSLPEGGPPSGFARTIARSAYLFVIAVVLAYLEVQIEGPNGWASALPTWRVTDSRLIWIFGGRPITGYHVALNGLILLFLHWPAMFGRWSWIEEARVLQAFAVLAVSWDFSWFVLNPHFGLARYDAAHVWWFKHWTLGVPTDYWVGISISFLIRIAPGLLLGEPRRSSLWEAMIGTLVPLFCVALIALIL